MVRRHWTAGALFYLAAFCFAACNRGTVEDEPQVAKVPRIALEGVLGTYTGSMTTAEGVEAVVLQIKDIVPLPDGFAFRYTLNVRQQLEDGLGSLLPDDTSTRVCFPSEICGWLLLEGGDLRIAADSESLDAPSWSLVKI